MTAGLDGSTYSYDAQNRLLSATKGGTIENFKYDGLNRQVRRTIGAGSPTYNVYDGWNLIGEYAAGATSPSAAYLTGAGGLVKNLITNRYYYQDASGSTSHLADSSGNLLEWYRYDLQGTPVFYNSSNSQLPSSGYGVRHLFTGQQWYNELGLYDLRNRFYSPDIGRFLQGDPIGFDGDASNLYRYCGNNPTNTADPAGEFAYVNQSGYNVTILIPQNYIYFGSGASALGDRFNTAISQMWTGDFGPYHVTTIAYTSYNEWETRNDILVYGGQTGVSTTGGFDGAWYEIPAGWGAGYMLEMACHEGGHEMGLVAATPDGNTTDANNIMTTLAHGAGPTQQDIEMILDASGNKCTINPAPSLAAAQKGYELSINLSATANWAGGTAGTKAGSNSAAGQSGNAGLSHGAGVTVASMGGGLGSTNWTYGITAESAFEDWGLPSSGNPARAGSGLVNRPTRRN